MADYWRRCSTCKTQLDFSANYWVCNVSTCNRKRTGLVFCSVSCWDAHVPLMNHREVWAEERKAPSKEEHERDMAGSSGGGSSSRSEKTPPVQTASGQSAGNSESNSGGRRVIKRSPTMQMVSSSPQKSKMNSNEEVEVLVVASKVKAYVKDHADMNTSASAFQALTHIVRAACRDATERAHQEGRKTVMDRDFKF